MKNKSLLNKKLILLVLVFAILIFIIRVYSEEIVDLDSYNFGKDMDKLLEYCKDPLACQRLTDNVKDDFLKGVRDSLDEKIVGKDKATKNLENLAELWLKKTEKTDSNEKKTLVNIFNDKSKNKFMEMLNSEQKQDFLKKMINSAFWKKYNRKDFKNPDKLGIKEVNIDEKNNKLSWVGNRLVTLDDKGKPLAWVDFENIPKWMNKMDFLDGKFQLGFFTGYVQKDVTLNGGTIGVKGEVIGPDGKVVGITLNQNIKSIKYENNNFVITYYDFKGDQKSLSIGQEKQISIAKENLPEGIFNGISKALENPNIRPYIEKVLSELNGIGIDAANGQSGSSLSDNQLNILISRESGKPEKINLDYSDSGKLKLSLENEGSVASMDSKGNVLATYGQFFSAEDKDHSSSEYIKEYNKNHPDSKITDEKADFVFALDGTIKASKNGVVSAPGFGSLMTSRDNLVGVDLIRNPYVDAMVRQDYKLLTETAAKEAYSTIERLAKEGKIDPNDLQAFGNLAIKESTGVLRRNIEDPSFSSELKKELNNALDATLRNLEKSQQNIADLLTQGASSSTQQNVAKGVLTDMSNSFVSDVADQLLDPQKAIDLINGNDKFRETFALEVLKSSLQKNPQLIGMVDDNSIIQKIAAAVGKDGVTVSSIINQAISQAVADSNPEKTLGERIIEKLDKNIPNEIETKGPDGKLITIKIPILSTDDKKNIADGIVATIKEYKKNLEAEGDRFVEEMKQYPEERKKTEYPNRAIMDLKNKEVVLMGSSAISFNAESPLNKFSVVTSDKSNNEKGDIMVLFSNGNYIAQFKGNEVFAPPSYSPGNYFSIKEIASETNPDLKLTLENKGYGDYVLSNQQRTVTSNYQIMGFVNILSFQLGFPIVASSFRNPVGGDVGLDSDTSISIQMTAGMDKGRIFNRIMNKQLTKQYGTNGIPLGKFTSQGETAMYDRLGQLISGIGGEDNLETLKTTGKQVFDFIDENNINLPGGQLATLPNGIVVGGDVRDFYTILSSITKDFNGNYYIPDGKKLLDFFGNHVIRQGSTITFTNNYISIDGDRLTDKDINPALFRTLTREISYNQKLIPSGVRLK